MMRVVKQMWIPITDTKTYVTTHIRIRNAKGDKADLQFQKC
jgi:hypothetical protein